MKGFGPKILSTDRKCFVSIQNFVSKTNIFNFEGTKAGKRKLSILKKCLFHITSREDDLDEGPW
jgi:hypothetical protein